MSTLLRLLLSGLLTVLALGVLFVMGLLTPLAAAQLAESFPEVAYLRWPYTVLLWVTGACALVVIGGVSLLQLTVAPGLLETLKRDADLVAQGEAWRLATAVLVQDGGWAGLISNLVFLAILGTLTERLLGRPRAAVAWLSGVAAGELTGLVWQPTGAGNSVGNLGLAGALAVVGWSRGGRVGRVQATAVAAGCALLLSGHDIHGAAALGGAFAAGTMTLRDQWARA